MSVASENRPLIMLKIITKSGSIALKNPPRKPINVLIINVNR